MKGLSRWRIVVSVAVLLSASGAAAWQLMPRQEDPTMPDRVGVVRVEYRGADAERVERDVVLPIERELAGIEGIVHVSAQARASYAVVELELSGGIHDTAEVWSEVAQALDRARADLPAEAGEPVLEHHLTYTESIVLAVTGSSDERALLAGAERLKQALLRHPDVADVHVAPDADEIVTIELEEGAARRYGIDRGALVAQLATRIQAVPGGDLRAGSRTAILRPNMEYASLEELESTPIAVAPGALVPLGELARVRPEVELGEGRVRYDGVPAVTVGVEPRPGVHAVELGDDVREIVARETRGIAPLRVDELVYQPEHIEARIAGLAQDLVGGAVLLVVMLVVFMGRRLGFVVGACVPVVTLSTLALYYFGGGVLHQISIASLAVALGMVVDNAMVVVEDMQRRIDLGEPNDEAARSAMRTLALPMGSATATTIAAYLPMLLAQSKTADFTRTLPALVTLALLVSYAAALFFVPVVAARFLRPSRRRGVASVSALGARLARFSVDRYPLVIGATIALVACTGVLGLALDTQFFPHAGRSEVLVSIELPGRHRLRRGRRGVARVEAALAARADVRTVAAFIGRTAPKFFYNLPVAGRAPSRAQLVVVAREPDAVEGLVPRRARSCERACRRRRQSSASSSRGRRSARPSRRASTASAPSPSSRPWRSCAARSATSPAPATSATTSASGRPRSAST